MNRAIGEILQRKREISCFEISGLYTAEPAGKIFGLKGLLNNSRILFL